MCKNIKEVHSKYWNHSLYVPCGRCPACLQSKANRRTNRIRHESNQSKYDMLFVQLDYENRFLPYILKSSLSALENGWSDTLSVYRDESFSLVFDRHSRKYHWKVEKQVCLATYTIEELRKNPNFDRTHICRGFNYAFRRTSGNRFNSVDNDVISVVFYKDVQDFLKRYRVYLNRNGYDFDTKYFCCSEYGPNTDRAHHHLFMCVPKGYFEVAKMAIAACWKFCNMHKPTIKNGKVFYKIEKAIAPQKYISEYVNSTHHVKGILQDCNKFRPQWHFSKEFGFANEKAFSFDEVKDKIYKGTLNYFATVRRDNVLTSELVPYPKYVISRYFPKFKGHHLLSINEIANLVRGSEIKRENEKKLSNYVKSIFIAPSLSTSFVSEVLTKTKLTYVELLDICSTLSRKCKELSLSPTEYAFLYSRVWPLYYSEVLKYSQLSEKILYQYFDNIGFYVNGSLEYNEFVPEKLPRHIVVDPNLFESNLRLHDSLVESFNEHEKTINVNSILYG